MIIEMSISRIQQYRAAKRWSKHAFARAAGLSAHSLKLMDDPAWSPTASTLRKLETVIPTAFASSHYRRWYDGHACPQRGPVNFQ